MSAVLTAMMFASTILSQPPSWQLRWQPGQVLSYRIEHITKATEVADKNRFELSSKLDLIKRWQVQNVDQQGVATLQMSVVSMRNEQVRPNGEVLLYDSAHPEKSTPGLREQMEKYIGKPLAVLRVDSRGKVVQIIQGSAAQFESDPPLVVRLPPGTPTPGQSWERLYQITLDPPYGTGEKYQGVQHYNVTKIADGLATIRLTTDLKLPDSPAERVPLLQRQPVGEIVFDIAAGRLLSAELRVDQTVQGHQGQNSSYRFESVYRQTYQR